MEASKSNSSSPLPKVRRSLGCAANTLGNNNTWMFFKRTSARIYLDETALPAGSSGLARLATQCVFQHVPSPHHKVWLACGVMNLKQNLVNVQTEEVFSLQWCERPEKNLIWKQIARKNGFQFELTLELLMLAGCPSFFRNFFTGPSCNDIKISFGMLGSSGYRMVTVSWVHGLVTTKIPAFKCLLYFLKEMWVLKKLEPCHAPCRQPTNAEGSVEPYSIDTVVATALCICLICNQIFSRHRVQESNLVAIPLFYPRNIPSPPNRPVSVYHIIKGF